MRAVHGVHLEDLKMFSYVPLQRFSKLSKSPARLANARREAWPLESIQLTIPNGVPAFKSSKVATSFGGLRDWGCGRKSRDLIVSCVYFPLPQYRGSLKDMLAGLPMF